MKGFPCRVSYRSPHARSLYDAEQRAKAARKRVWEGYQEEGEGEQNGEEEEEEKEEDVSAAIDEEESERTTNYHEVCTSGRVLLLSCTTAPPPPQVLVVGVIDPITFWGQLEDQGWKGHTRCP